MRANKPVDKLYIAFFAGTLCLCPALDSYAQDSEQARPPQAPTPGATVPPPAPQYTAPPQAASGESNSASAAPPQTRESGEAPLPGSPDAPNRLTSVISLHDAESWISNFKNQSGSPSPQVLDKIGTFYEWLLELLDEHNRLAVTFAKNESTRILSSTEKQTVAKLNHLKNEVLLLRANMLIRLNRYAEAIVPLVDVVNAEPLSENGKEAYKDLQDIGFSEIPDLTQQSIDSVPVPAASMPAALPPAVRKPPAAKAKTKAKVKITRRYY